MRFLTYGCPHVKVEVRMRWSFENTVAEDSSLLGCYTVQTGIYLPTFRETVLPPSSGPNNPNHSSWVSVWGWKYYASPKHQQLFISWHGVKSLKIRILKFSFILGLLLKLFDLFNRRRFLCSLKYSGPSNFERFDVRTTWNSKKKFEENPVLKLEQKLESRTKNHVVVTRSPSLSAWSRWKKGNSPSSEQ
jgi:hypothetical protein